MANPIQALNENFFYNSMLARALVQLLPADDRTTVRAWLDVLHKMNDDREEMAIRNDYMWFLLLVLQGKRMTVPFNKLPPPEIRPLEDILPPKVYEEILMKTDQNMAWLDEVDAEENPDCPAAKKAPVESGTAPCNFFDSQPTPQQGVMCYLAAFSDHD